MFRGLMPKMLNREAAKGDSDAIFDVLGDLRGCTIGDVGSGGGFFTVRFARAVGAEGRVYAIDNNDANLAYVEALARREGCGNIETIFTPDNKIPLPLETVDLFFSRNSFHHIPEPARYFARLRPLLKPEGKIVVIDHVRSRGWTFANLFGHFTSEAFITSTLEQAGYWHAGRHTILKNQSFNVFERADAA